MTDRFLVTGGAGFIGSHLVDRLVSEGFSVSVLDNLSTGDIRNLDQSINEIDFMQGDIRNQADVDAAVRDVDVVINLAALGSVPRSVADPMSTHEVNATGTLRMLLASRDAGARRFIQASSSSVYGDSHVLPKVETEMGRVASPYAASKCVAEDYCRLASDMYGLDTVRLRFFNVFGPRQKADHVYAAVIPKFVDWALRGETLVVHGDGRQSRDFTYIDNNIDGILGAAMCSDPRITGGVFNLACGGNLTLLQIIELIEVLNGGPLNVELGPVRAGDILHSHADISALTNLTGYSPQVSVEEGIERTWEAYRTTGLLRFGSPL